MDIIQGKDSFNEMATGILVKLFADYPFYSSFDFSDFGWKPRGDGRHLIPLPLCCKIHIEIKLQQCITLK
ncbi:MULTISPECIES: hypothetical protein [Enterobacter]|uniref:DUF3289 family protein n=2 Tax=Enterobacter TaxID=547 RepID=A0ABU9PHJ8_9ENTR|nr:hypothetical protein [Enterobacter genomosp. S]KZR30147.1 hypothetical protein A3466_07180 [Enterobacter genomosp. S]PNC13932.1 hypothetical protein CK477_05445 [Enterobacter cloacae]